MTLPLSLQFVSILAMMSLPWVVWCLVFAYGVTGESMTPSDEWWTEVSTPEDSSPDDQQQEWQGTDTLDPLHYDLPSNTPSSESEWSAYSPEMYHLFRKAVKELAATEHGILILWDTLNRREPPREFFEPVFTAYNRLANEDWSSTTEGSQYSTAYTSIETTEPLVSEESSDVYTVKESASSVEDSEQEYHTSTAHNDEAAVYFTTESPLVESMLTDDAVYDSSISPEGNEDAFEEVNMYMTSEDDVHEAIIEDEIDSSEDSIVEVPENELEDIRRSGEVAEAHSSTEAAASRQFCERCPLQVGSIRGIPGVHFPNYDDIPITSFSCADKKVPGFYADLETGCQVFHVCWPYRRESYLCPIGTLFNQAILTCDYWYSTDCSSSHYFDITTLSPKPKSTTAAYEKQTPSTSKPTPKPLKTTKSPSLSSSTTEAIPTQKPTEIPNERPYIDLDWFRASKFLPAKTKVTVYSKHSEKPGSKWVGKQKHDVIPLVEEFLKLAKNVAKNAIGIVPQVNVAKPVISKSKVVKVKPSVKLEPCLEITKPPVVKPQPLPKLDPRFIVKPVVVEKPVVKVHLKKQKLVFPKVSIPQVKPTGVHKLAKGHVPEIVMKALDMAGNVLQRDILDLTRQALVENHVNSLKSKH